MPLFSTPQKPVTPLGWHRVLSPTAAVKVSPICLGGISIGNAWSELFGRSENDFAILDAFFALGGNFIDTANQYNCEESERIIGEWMETRGTRDQMVIATKYSAPYRAYNRDAEPIQSNLTGNSAKSMHISVRDSLKKLRTDYIDILYVHWWELTASVEEVMTHLHTYIIARQVLYLGVSDTPAWVVVKANDFARQNGLTPFSVYQGRWCASRRDVESEIIPMCEDQGMAFVSWGSLGGGLLATAAERERMKKDPDAPKAPYGFDENDAAVCDVLEQLAIAKSTSLKAIALAYLFHQTTYVFPIVGVQTVEHVKAMPEALRVRLSTEDIDAIHNATPFNPLFPNNYYFPYENGRGYSLRLTVADHKNYRAGAWISAPPKQPVS
ncbi:probable voltage-gated shaker-like K+ channel, subunit beta/KCNAB [Fusarium oxysporum]|uniref:Probable voltage-gated shaker-like K+ channel, subunit beta/KCNAB n=1 Tax=Fusarium oxysporum TaxID=5507 RepID=A0A2H3TK83_FUSOX|nr:probable voltage-gated shaker-like K+ channel, subunit beta/KCNAB [Fusarium oxysporum]